MENALQTWLSPMELKNRVERIRQVHKDIMKDEIHFGIIPGCQKPSLWQPGAQLLLMTFRVANKSEVIDLSTHDEAKYRVITTLYDQAGNLLGTGVGEASSLEEKYMWRKAVCDEEWESYPEERRRTAYKKSRDGFYTIKQVRTNPADVANTILKMANKRSIVNSTCTCLGASEVFTQDAETLPPEMVDDDGSSQRKSTKPVLNQKTEVVKPTTGFYIQDVSVKNGVGRDKKGTRYGVKIEGVYYGSFSDTLGKLATDCWKNKIPVVFQHEKKGDYDNLVSLQAVTAPATEPETAAEATRSVMGQEDFLQLVKSLSEQAGITDVDAEIKNQLKIDGLKSVTVEQQCLVVDLLNFLIENKGK